MGSITAPDPTRGVAAIFNSAIAAPAIATAWEVGLLDELQQAQTVDVRSFAAEHDLHCESTQGLVAALATVDVVKLDLQQGSVTAGTLLHEARRTASLFHWLALGSGPLFSRMQHVLRNKNRHGKYYSRDSAAIAFACRDANAVHFDPVFWAAMEELDFGITRAVDLGSGSGERLMQILEKYPGTTALGVDIAGPAVQAARGDALARGLGERLSFVEGDVLNLEYRDEFAGVDLLTSFLMGHDFWPRENCVATLRRLRGAFPRARRFFLADTTRILLGGSGDSGERPRPAHGVAADDVPIFTLGFEFGHAMMSAYIPTLEEWEGVFEEGGWRLVKEHHVMPPSLSVIFVLEPVD